MIALKITCPGARGRPLRNHVIQSNGQHHHKRESPHHVNGCCASRCRLRYLASRTTAPRLLGYFGKYRHSCRALRRVAPTDRPRISCILGDDLSDRGVDATRIVSQGSGRVRNGQLHSLYRYCLCAASLGCAKELPAAPGGGAASQRLITTDERSGLHTRIAATARRLRVQISGRMVWIDQTFLQK